jgi:hypothetical protein
MHTQTCRCSNLSPAADLLPWADPYIVQLFEEAEMARRAEIAESVSSGHAVDRCDCVGRSAEVLMIGARESRRLTRPGRQAISRRRKTEFALQLAPC